MNSKYARPAMLFAFVAVFSLLAAFDVHAVAVAGHTLFTFDPVAIMAGGSALAFVGETADVQAELKRINDSVKEEGTKALKAAEKGIELSEKNKDQIDELLGKQGELQGTVLALAQKVDQAKLGARDPGTKTMGEQLIENADFQAFAKQGARARGSISVPVLFREKSVVTVDSTTGSGGAWVRPDRITSPMVTPGLRRFTIRDLMAPGRTNSNLIEYVQETGFQNMAAVVPDGTLKAQSDISFTLIQQAVATIAHWLRATKIILDDAPMMESYVDTRLRYGLALIEELQLLMGSGTGGNLKGIYTTATAYAAPYTPASAVNVIDQLRLALLQVTIAEYPADGIVLNPIDWDRCEGEKNTQGNYIIGNPQGTIAPRLWNRPVVATNSMPVNKFLVGAFGMASQIFDREDANVVISTEDQDNFVKNLVTIRAEERLTMAVYRPEAFVKGDLTAAEAN